MIFLIKELNHILVNYTYITEGGLSMNSDLSHLILRETALKDGKKLTVRIPEVEDAEEMVEYCNTVGGESDNLTFGKNEFHLNVEQEEEYIRNLKNNQNSLTILGIVDNTIVSMANIVGLKKKRLVHNSEIGISVRKDYWKNGIGSIMMEELIKFAKEKGMRNISLGVRADNKNAIKLYEKFGFQQVGLHKDYFNINGVFYDEILMDLYI